MLTQEELKSHLQYNPKTGVFVWRIKRGRQAAGSTAGSAAGSGGYVRIMVLKRLYLAHRLAWLYVFGHFPAGELDHRNGLRTDNRIRNLRDATRAVNNQNKRAALPRSFTGFLGVTRDKRDGRYYARIYSNGRQISLGGYATPEAAHAAYVKAKRQLHAGCTI